MNDDARSSTPDTVFEMVEHQRPACLEVQVHGSLDLFTYPRLKDIIQAWKLEGEQQNVVFNFKHAQYVGSAGWAIVFQAATECKKRGGCCVIHSMDEQIMRTFSLLQVQEILCTIAASHREAMEIVLGHGKKV